MCSLQPYRTAKEVYPSKEEFIEALLHEVAMFELIDQRILKSLDINTIEEYQQCAALVAREGGMFWRIRKGLENLRDWDNK